MLDKSYKWTLPGGRLDPKETPKKAAKRECLEEIGYKPKKPLPLAHAVFSSKDITLYLKIVADEFDPDLNDEHHHHKWADLDALASLVDLDKKLRTLIMAAMPRIESKLAGAKSAPANRLYLYGRKPQINPLERAV